MKKNVNISGSDEILYKQICELKKEIKISEFCRKVLEEELKKKTEKLFSNNSFDKLNNDEIDFFTINENILNRFKKEAIKIFPYKKGYKFGWKWNLENPYENLIISKNLLIKEDIFDVPSIFDSIIRELDIPEDVIKKDLFLNDDYHFMKIENQNIDDLKQWLHGFLKAVSEFWDQIDEEWKEKAE
jgi:hypothetical protein